MIIVDYSGIAFPILRASAQLDISYVRIVLLNNIRKYIQKYSKTYGKLVIACDGGSWRKGVFSNYKWKRSESKEQDDYDWEEFFKILNQLSTEIKENTHYPVIKLYGAEGDDIIAVLCQLYSEDKHMIISGDKDFQQLHTKNIRQYSPITRKLFPLLSATDKERFIFEHVVRGDGSDGVPNILSDGDVFVEGIRQKSIYKRTVDEWFDNKDRLKTYLDEDVYNNFLRNRELIDFNYIPEHIKENIIAAINTEFNKKIKIHRRQIFKYLVANRCKELIKCVGDFYE